MTSEQQPIEPKPEPTHTFWSPAPENEGAARPYLKRYFLVGGASLVILPLIWGADGFLYACGFCFVLLLIYWMHDHFSNEHPPLNNALYVAGIFALLIYRQMANDRSKPTKPITGTPRVLRPIDSPDNARHKMARLTANYWNLAVADLHPYRFFFVVDENESAGGYYQRLISQLKREVREAKDVSTVGVDPELVTMSAALLSQDEQLVQIFEQLDAYGKKLGSAQDDAPIGQRVKEGEQLVTELFNDPVLLDRIDDQELRVLVERLLEFEVIREEQFREVEIMQARMQERYKGTTFLLLEPPE